MLFYANIFQINMLSHCSLRELYFTSDISYKKEDFNLNFRRTLCLNKQNPLQNFNTNATAVCKRNMWASCI